MALILPDIVFDASENIGMFLPFSYFTEEGPSTLDFAPSGGMTVSGTAGVIFVDVTEYAATGGMLISGEAYIDLGNYMASGGFTVGGTAAVTFIDAIVYEHTATGGFSLSGEADISEGVGGFSLGGSATVSFVDILLFEFTATGGLTISGTADEQAISVYTIEATGGMSIAGSASSAGGFVFTPSGGFITTGAATVVAKFPVHVPSGGIQLDSRSILIFKPFDFVLTPENPDATVFSGWAMNYNTAAASRYEDLPANSFCNFNGKTFVANAGGVYELKKGTDAGQPIKCSVTVLSNDDFGSRNNKRVPYVYLGYESSARMKLTVVTNKHSVNYYDVLTPNDENRGNRVILGRGLDGMYWTVRLSNVDGAYFELDNFYVYPTILRRMGV